MLGCYCQFFPKKNFYFCYPNIYYRPSTWGHVDLFGVNHGNHNHMGDYNNPVPICLIFYDPPLAIFSSHSKKTKKEKTNDNDAHTYNIYISNNVSGTCSKQQQNDFWVLFQGFSDWAVVHMLQPFYEVEG